ncbi:MAG: TetR/AcrR family transcriptional regulator [Candidatus Aquilonibacter sp.]
MAFRTQGPARRSLTPKGQATRDRIVAAAARLIFEKGATETTTEDVRAAAGISFSQLYHYFEDKPALIHAVIVHQADAVLARQEEFLGRLDSMRALRAWRDFLVEVQRQAHCEGGCPLGTLSIELSEISADARRDLSYGFARWEDGIRTGLRAMHERGELKADVDPDRLALATLAAVQGGLLLTQVRRETAPLEAALDTVLAHIESSMATSGAAKAV